MEPKRTDSKKLLFKTVQAALIIAACTAWLVFAINCWGFKGTWLSNRDEPLLQPLWRFLNDRKYKESCGIYLSLAGGVLFIFYVSVLLPDLMRRFFPLRGRKLLVFKIIIIVLTCAAAYISYIGCLSRRDIPTALAWIYPKSDHMAVVLKYANIYLIPVSLFLILFAWTVPAIIHFFKKAAREHFLNAGYVGRTLAFYALLVVIQILLTAASAALLSVVGNFYPNARSFVGDMEKGISTAATGIFLTAVLAPVIEETAFRGIMQHHVKRVLPAVVSILFASVYFGLWHRNLTQFLYTFCWGTVSGVIYNATGKVRHTIMMHAVGNLLSAIAFSTTSSSLLGKHVVLPAIQSWIMALPLVPAVIVMLVLVTIMLMAIETALYIATGKENRFIRLIKNKLER